MNNYQLTLLVKNDLSENDRKALLDDVVKSFGKTNKEDVWGTKNLSYPIQHQSSAFYAHYEFESEPNTISSLDKKLKLNEDVIRYLLLRIELPKKVEKKPKKVASSAKKTEDQKEDKKAVEDKTEDKKE